MPQNGTQEWLHREVTGKPTTAPWEVPSGKLTYHWKVNRLDGICQVSVLRKRTPVKTPHVSGFALSSLLTQKRCVFCCAVSAVKPSKHHGKQASSWSIPKKKQPKTPNTSCMGRQEVQVCPECHLDLFETCWKHRKPAPIRCSREPCWLSH